MRSVRRIAEDDYVFREDHDGQPYVVRIRVSDSGPTPTVVEVSERWYLQTGVTDAGLDLPPVLDEITGVVAATLRAGANGGWTTEETFERAGTAVRFRAARSGPKNGEILALVEFAVRRGWNDRKLIETINRYAATIVRQTLSRGVVEVLNENGFRRPAGSGRDKVVNAILFGQPGPTESISAAEEARRVHGKLQVVVADAENEHRVDPFLWNRIRNLVRENPYPTNSDEVATRAIEFTFELDRRSTFLR